jgi:protein farnesyltransferase subunit beta
MEFLMESNSTDDQEDAERECLPFFVDLHTLSEPEAVQLRKRGLLDEHRQVCLLYDAHSTYLRRAFGTLASSFVSLDSSRPWILYWTLHGCDMLGDLPDSRVLNGIVSTLQACWEHVGKDAGGFGGGPGQMAHCAPTYAAVLCLCIIATCHHPETAMRARDYLNEIRIPLRNWYVQLQEDGAYRMHFGGEIDVRATYTVLCCAKLLNIINEELVSPAVIKFVLDCQTFEGGFGGEPGSEAHGGYTFCAVAALQLTGTLGECDMAALRGWLVRRQMSYEGGFQGRCNKLVDGCYSFWQGAAIAILNGIEGDPWLDGTYYELPPLLYNEAMLQRYVLLCAQDVNGGLRDKPSSARDFYHSCYNLSGLSVGQHFGSISFGHKSSSVVSKTHPCYNIRIDRAASVLKHFATAP